MAASPDFAELFAPLTPQDSELLTVFERIAHLPQCLLLENYEPGTSVLASSVGVSNLLTGQNLLLFRGTILMFKAGPVRLVLSTTPLRDGGNISAAFSTEITVEQAKKILSVWSAQALSVGLST